MGRGAASLVPTGPVPPNYICRRCFQPGHWIQECPTNGKRQGLELLEGAGLMYSDLKIGDCGSFRRLRSVTWVA